MLKGQISFEENDVLTGDVLDSPKIFDHNYLYNRDALDAHPITAIEGLTDRLAALEELAASKTAPPEPIIDSAQLDSLAETLNTEIVRAKKAEQEIKIDLEELTDKVFLLDTTLNDAEQKKVNQEVIEKLNQLDNETKTEINLLQNNISDLETDLAEISDQILLSEATTKAELRKELATSADVEGLAKNLSKTLTDLNSVNKNITDLNTNLFNAEAALNDEIVAEKLRATKVEDHLTQLINDINAEIDRLIKTQADSSGITADESTNELLQKILNVQGEAALTQEQLAEHIKKSAEQLTMLQDKLNAVINSDIVDLEESQRNVNQVLNEVANAVLDLRIELFEQLLIYKNNIDNLKNSFIEKLSPIETYIDTNTKMLTELTKKLSSEQTNREDEDLKLESNLSDLKATITLLKQQQQTADEGYQEQIKTIQADITKNTSLLTDIKKLANENSANISILTGQFIAEKLNRANVDDNIHKLLDDLQDTVSELQDQVDTKSSNDSVKDYVDQLFTEALGHINHLIINYYESRVSNIEAWKKTVSNVMDFVGVTTSDLVNDFKTTPIIQISSGEHSAIPGDVVIYSNKEYVWTGESWEEFGNVTELSAGLASLTVTLNERATTHDTEINNLKKDYYLRPATLIFESLSKAEEYLVNNSEQVYPGMLITVNTEGLLETYILNTSGSLELFSGGGGGGYGSPDRVTDTQYCVQERSGRILNITNATLNTFKNAPNADSELDDAVEIIQIAIDKPERKNNKIMTYSTPSPGGYVYYVSKLPDLKFTSSGFDAGFTRLADISLNGYYVYRTNQKLIEPVEIIIN
jgi:hypothetical protein